MTHGIRIKLISVIALPVLATIVLSSCSEDSSPILSNKTEAPQASSSYSGTVEKTGSFSQSHNSDKLFAKTDGGPVDSIRLIDEPPLDTVYIRTVDTVIITDTLLLGELRIDTVLVREPLTGEWLRFSAYMRAVAYIKQEFPDRSGDRFSSLGEFADYNAGTPAGRAGFNFVDNGDSTYAVRGYSFEYVFGAIGFAWGAREGRPTENTYNYSGVLRLRANGEWDVLNLSSARSGNFIRDTRHD